MCGVIGSISEFREVSKDAQMLSKRVTLNRLSGLIDNTSGQRFEVQ